MIYLLRSIFSNPEPRVLLLGAERAILYLFDGGELAQAYIFQADESGLALFERCLTEITAAPLAVLIDVVEEEYRQDSIPHLGAPDRRAMLARKYARLFRGTPFHHTLRQGRESAGRRDDRVLLTALTRPELLTPWLDKLLAHKVPVAGIFSLPVLSENLLQRIGASSSNVLLISLQKASGLRQTFFRDGQLKISRLAHMPRLGSVPFAQHLLGEVEKLRRYLNSLALISRDSPLSIYILSHGPLLEELRQHCRDSEQERFVLLDIDAVGRDLALEAPGESHFSDLLYARLLAMRVPRNHYARPADMQFYNLHRVRLALASASLILALASLAWSGINFVEGVTFKQAAIDAMHKAAFYQDRYELARRKLPVTPVEPRDIKTAVDAVAALRQHKNNPETMLQLVAGALDDAPQIELDQLRWIGSADANAPVQDHQARRTTAPAVAAKAYFQIAEVSAHLRLFDGDYAKAMRVVDALASNLKTHATVVAVQVLQYPLDVRSEASVSGSATATGDTAVSGFKLKLVVGIDDGHPPG